MNLLKRMNDLETKVAEQYTELKKYVGKRCSKYNSSIKHLLCGEFKFPVKNDEEMAKQEERIKHDSIFRKKLVCKMCELSYIYTLFT